LTDYFFTRKRIVLIDDLFAHGAYWYTKGVHWIAVICWVIGALVFWLGRYSQVGGAIPSFIVAAVLYLILRKSLEKKENL